MKDLSELSQQIPLSFNELAAIIKEYLVSKLNENVEITYKEVLDYKNNIEDAHFNFRVVNSTKVFEKNPNFDYELTRDELIECLNEVLSTKEENTYEIVTLDKVELDEPNSSLSGNERFVFSVQKIKKNTHGSVLSIEPRK